MKRGGESDPSVDDRTIGGSRVAVVLISEKYASSPRCLESLVKIMGFYHSGSLQVIPVFYDIDPWDVRNQSGKLCKPFSLHKKEYPGNVQTWRQTLSQLADIPSCQYSKNWKGDAELISKITNDIWGMLIGSKSSDLCGLVGMDRHMKAIFGMLDLGLKEQVRWIQIWGSHGIGKTQFARYLYEEIWHHFDTHVWQDIFGLRSRDDLDYDRDLTKDLLYELRDKIPRGYTERVLLVLDNFVETVRIYDLKKEFDSFGPGSRVIIISRKMHISHLDLGYEIVGLKFSEALQLFCLSVFQQTHPSLGFEELSCRAVNLTGGSPLTIERLGLRLSGKDRDEWELILFGYERQSLMGIIDSEKIIFDSPVTHSVSTPCHSTGLVGMNSRMQAVTGLLELGSDKEVRVVGIWGTGGIGKTTLARYAYEGISQQFSTLVFLEIVQDHSSSFCLQKQFLSKAIQSEAFAIRTSKDGLDVMKSGLQHQKSLLIVDGVDNNKALEDVWKIASWFDPGSRVVVTTRDERLLLANGVKHVYEVKCLTVVEALQLFNQFALKRKCPYRFHQLSVRAIKHVGYLPLALKVAGSMLYEKDEKYWESILQSFGSKTR